MTDQEFKLLWEMIVEIQKNTATMNYELGVVAGQMIWIKIILSALVVAIIGNAIGLFYHHRKNSKE